MNQVLGFIESLKKHLVENLKKGVRKYGRKNDEFREVTIERGVTKTAEGSAKVTIGDTVVIAGVKLSIGLFFGSFGSMSSTFILMMLIVGLCLPTYPLI